MAAARDGAPVPCLLLRRATRETVEGGPACASDAARPVVLLGADVMGLRGVLRTIAGGDLGFWCPGCEEMHVLSPGWTFDGNYERPTFSPSVLVTNGCKTPQFKPGDDCWCTFNAEAVQAGREPSGFQCSRCHLFVKAGHIEFLSDSTHKLAGQTVEMKAPP